MEEGRLLDVYEQRVLGVLLEKEQTTPDSYPLTINQTIAGCNQKSNRDPVVEMTETEVVEALDRLRLEVLTWRTEGARVEKWEHSVTRRWHLVPRRKAVLTHSQNEPAMRWVMVLALFQTFGIIYLLIACIWIGWASIQLIQSAFAS